MADNSSIPVASGNETFGNKDVGGVKYPQHIQVDSAGAEVVSATAAKQDTGNTSLATIATNTTGAATETTLAALNAKIPATPATTGGQATANASLAAINTVLGAKTDAKSTATDATSISAMQVLKQISAYLAGSLTVATHAVTQSGSWVLAAGSALIGKVQISDGTNNAVVKAASTAAEETDTALVVAMRPDSLADPFAEYEAVAASQTDVALGATGATGDYLSAIWIFPATAACGAVTIKDGATTIYTFPGGGTTALPSLAPIPWMPGIKSKNGAFTVTTGANVSVMGVGDFT